MDKSEIRQVLKFTSKPSINSYAGSLRAPSGRNHIFMPINFPLASKAENDRGAKGPVVIIKNRQP